MCQPRVDRSVGSPSLEDSDIRIEKKMELEGKTAGRTRLFTKWFPIPFFTSISLFWLRHILVVSNSLCANGWFLQKGVAQPKEKVIKGKWK